MISLYKTISLNSIVKKIKKLYYIIILPDFLLKKGNDYIQSNFFVIN